MEFYLSFSSIVTITFFVIILAFLLDILNKKRAKIGKIRKPPQVKGTLPIIGHLHLLRGPRLPYMVLSDMAETYGPIFTIKLGFHEALVVSNAEIARECLTTNDKAFAGRPKGKAFEIMAYNYAVFGFSPYGDYWRRLRKLIVLEVLSQRQVEILRYVRASEVRASIKDMYESWLLNNKSGKGNSDSVKVEMKQWFGNISLNIIVRIICGKRFPPNDEDGVQFRSVIRKYFELLGAFVVSDYIPFLECLDIGGYNKPMNKIFKEVDDILERWLTEQKNETEQQGNQVFMKTLLSVLEDATPEDYLAGFDKDTVIKATCQQILTAALDTTSATLTWTLSLLLNNPKALEIAQAEMDEHVGRERLVEESDLKNLVYLEAIIKESMRLYPAVPLSVPHESIEDCVVGGYHIPKGTRLLLNIAKIHHDPNIWSDPYEFRPERFLTTHKDVDVKGKYFELVPFSSGRRMCPGGFFALQVMRLTLASLIQQFVLKRPSNEPIDMTESAGISNSKGTPLDVLVAPRLSLNMYDVSCTINQL